MLILLTDREKSDRIYKVGDQGSYEDFPRHLIFFDETKDKKMRLDFFYKIALFIADGILVALSAILTAWAFFVNGVAPEGFWWLLLFNVLATWITFAFFGLYNIVFSSVGLPDVSKNVLAVIILGVINLLVSALFPKLYLSLGVVVSYTAILSVNTVIVRCSKRLLVLIRDYVFTVKDRTRIMIVGGGEAGASLIKELQTSDKIYCRPVCVIDDNPDKLGKWLHGVRVVGTTADISAYAKKYEVQEIFVAMPSVGKKRVSEIVALCQKCNLPVRILPGIYQFVNGQITVSDFRKVEIQDLLGREQVQVNLAEIMGYIEDKIVLVTGGGGSIGSELCRQIAAHAPKRLIILDIYENNAYEIEQELKRHYPELSLLTLIASVRDMRKMEDVFATYRPQIVFHAAAHKHVPLMETSPNEAVKNNVFGTLNVAKCADKYGVETFVQISTDKAVNPTNIMGATKRICEMLVQEIGRKSKTTKFVAVRFGNVLGSNGSVIPLFKKQIEEGGPVTVTHKDIIRYFMTIPEAVSLVLQAGAYAQGGQIFVLDMGEPVRIYDLAYNLIKLSGLEPNVDIDIVCTGLRPGEKLYEERLMKEEGLQKTPNGLINIARPLSFDEKRFWELMDKLYEGAYSETDAMKEYVKELVPTYTIDKSESVFKKLEEKQNEQPLLQTE